MKCQICELRKPRRYCPGVRGEICPQCCGTEREQTVDCPRECDYLREARLYEKLPPLNPEDFPNKDIRVSEAFLLEQELLVVFAGAKLLEAALETPGAIDNDLREALESLIRTYRTLETGLYYETMPANVLAAGIHSRMQEEVADLRERLAEKGSVRPRDADVLGVLVFLQRLEMHHNNGRKRGRAFLDFLRSNFPAAEQAPAQPSLIQV